MKRIAVWMLLAALHSTSAHAAEPAALPTTPQVPAPTLGSGSRVQPLAGPSGRVLGALRERIGLARPAPEAVQAAGATEHIDAPAAAAPIPEPAACAPCDRCGGSIIPGSPIKRWFCYRPTTGHELPWLRPHPYVGPITGQFPCSSAGCAPCTAGQPGCDPAAGECGRGILGGGRLGRGCRDGTCAPTPDEAFGGYRFAVPENRHVVPRTAPPAATTSYKPTVTPTGLTTPAATPRQPTILESIKRTFSSP